MCWPSTPASGPRYFNNPVRCTALALPWHSSPRALYSSSGILTPQLQVQWFVPPIEPNPQRPYWPGCLAGLPLGRSVKHDVRPPETPYRQVPYLKKKNYPIKENQNPGLNHGRTFSLNIISSILLASEHTFALPLVISADDNLRIFSIG